MACVVAFANAARRQVPGEVEAWSRRMVRRTVAERKMLPRSRSKAKPGTGSRDRRGYAVNTHLLKFGRKTRCQGTFDSSRERTMTTTMFCARATACSCLTLGGRASGRRQKEEKVGGGGDLVWEDRSRAR